MACYTTVPPSPASFPAKTPWGILTLPGEEACRADSWDHHCDLQAAINLKCPRTVKMRVFLEI